VYVLPPVQFVSPTLEPYYPPSINPDLPVRYSFYTEDAPPFVDAMANSLKEAGNRTRRLPGTGWMFGTANRTYQEDIALQHKIADEVSTTTEGTT